MDYDAGAEEASVKSLMQAQHKATLRDLKNGRLDEKINAYLGDREELLPSQFGAVGSDAAPAASADDGSVAVTEPAAPAPELVPVAAPEPATAPVSAAPEPATPQPIIDDPTRPEPSVPGRYSRSRRKSQGKPAPGQFERLPTGKLAQVESARADSERIERLAPSRTGTGTSRRVVPATPKVAESTPAGKRSRAGSERRAVPARPGSSPGRPGERHPPRRGVVVSRPAVIVGAPSQVIGGGGAPSAKSRTETESRRVRDRARDNRGGSLFGKDLISEKSLDEVILAYLSDDSSEE